MPKLKKLNLNELTVQSFETSTKIAVGGGATAKVHTCYPCEAGGTGMMVCTVDCDYTRDCYDTHLWWNC